MVSTVGSSASAPEPYRISVLNLTGEAFALTWRLRKQFGRVLGSAILIWAVVYYGTYFPIHEFILSDWFREADLPFTIGQVINWHEWFALLLPPAIGTIFVVWWYRVLLGRFESTGTGVPTRWPAYVWTGILVYLVKATDIFVLFAVYELAGVVGLRGEGTLAQSKIVHLMHQFGGFHVLRFAVLATLLVPFALLFPLAAADRGRDPDEVIRALYGHRLKLAAAFVLIAATVAVIYELCWNILANVAIKIAAAIPIFSDIWHFKVGRYVPVQYATWVLLDTVCLALAGVIAAAIAIVYRELILKLPAKATADSA